MPSRHARRRAASTSAVRRTRGDIYRLAYRRARRAINAGFYLEAIAITESILADRLEAALSMLRDEPVRFGTVGEAVRELARYPGSIDPLLLDQVQVWSRGRSRWIHEFAKVADGPDLNWRQRLSDAHEVALSGFDLATRVSAAAKRLRNQQRR